MIQLSLFLEFGVRDYVHITQISESVNTINQMYFDVCIVSGVAHNKHLNGNPILVYDEL